VLGDRAGRCPVEGLRSHYLAGMTDPSGPARTPACWVWARRWWPSVFVGEDEKHPPQLCDLVPLNPSWQPEPMYNPTSISTPSRHPDRASYDAATVHEILDEALICHVGFVADSRPHVLPMTFVRMGSSVYLHSSTGAHMARMAARGGGLEVALEVSVVDALVFARAGFNHSLNYRSVVAHGTATLVGDDAKKASLDALMEKLAPGRSGDVRAATEAELRQTAVLVLPLVDVSAKIRSGPPADDLDDLSLTHWAGLVPIREVRGTPEPSPDLAPGITLPRYL